MLMVDDTQPNPDVPFGDWEPEDSVVAEVGDIDPLQVARRIHENRREIEALAGNYLEQWSGLTIEEQGFAIDFASDLVKWLKIERGI
jgi:hypothetical protein